MHLSLRASAFFAVLWVVILLSMVGYSGWRATQGPVFDTDIFSLFPKEKQSETARYAQQKITEGFGQKIFVLIGDKDKIRAVNAAHDYQKALGNVAGVDVDNMGKNSARMRKLIEKLAQHQSGLLTPKQRQMLEEGDVEAIRNQVLLQLYGIGALPLFSDITHDPLTLFSHYIQDKLLSTLNHFEMVEDVAVVADEGVYYAYIGLTLNESAFHLDFQERAKQGLDTIEKEIKQAYPEVEIIRSGLLFHLFNGSQMAQDEISWMGSLSFIGTCLVLILAFRSVQPFAATMVMVVLGCIVGFASCLLIFGKVHLLTMVFGTSLIGISVDYALHFFTERYRQTVWSPREAVDHIRTCIVLGLITSLIGFLGICIVPFPGLQQMAVFCCAGLIFSCGSVLFWFPYGFKNLRRQPSPALYRYATIYLTCWSHPWLKRYALPVLVATTVIGGIALFFVQGKDEVRGMQPISAALLQNDLRVSKLLHKQFSPQFFVISGRTTDEVLLRQEQLTRQLDGLITEGKLAGYQAMSQFIPSIKAQTENRNLLSHFIAKNNDVLTNTWEQIGIAPDVLEHYAASIPTQPQATIEEIAPYIADTPLSALWLGEFRGKVLALVTLETIHDVTALRALHSPENGVEFLDKINDISLLLSQYRYWISICITLSYLIIGVFLWKRYGFKKGLVIILPSVFAAVFSIVIASVIFGSYTLFNIMALFLVMGIAVDYTLFLSEAEESSRATMVAVFLSTVTTLLSFGLLSLSATTVLRDFGVVVCIGLTLTLLFTPLTTLYTHRFKS